ncbi:MAG: prepilin-type N-terminal cleavage/methylation domain-containing protein [Pseudomonadota bacterium]
MTYPPHITYKRAAERGVTLLEVLVVVGILAVVAGIGAQVFTGVVDDSEDQLVGSEMTEVANAMKRFRRDTGYWPHQGVFAAEDGVANPLNPGNLSQLFFEPTAGGAQIMPFDATSGSGWNGPYLTEYNAVSVDIGGNLALDGTGDPGAGAETAVRGVGDPFAAQPVGDLFDWTTASGDTPLLGRPYLYFVNAAAQANVANCLAPCLVSLGPNGAYDAGAGDDIVMNLGALN